ncbi:MAG: sulfite reductase SirA [Candidatus Acidiferrum sp.]
MSEVKETKAQKVERLKREKVAWDRLDEIREFARQGHGSIPPEWLGTYFRTWGIYTQGDGLGVVGGKNGEGNQTQYFMVRIRIPNGLLTSEQARVIANLAEEYGRGVADITVRQNIQLHWVTIENIPDLIERLQRIALTSTGACGDVVRNVTGCPVAGIDSHEIIDASPFALAIDKKLGGNRDFYNLPRKFKMTVSGCSSWCSYPEINDVAFTATKRVRAGREEIGFSVRIGGGLSTEPHLAVRLNAFVKQEQVQAVARGVAEIFRASEVLRQSRDKARLKYLFLQHGWTAESFLTELERQIAFQLDRAEEEEIPADIHRDHLGVHRQKQPGLFYVGASVLRGRISPAQLRKVAELAEVHGDGHVRLTVQQNILLLNLPQASVNQVTDELNLAGLPVAVSAFARGTVACTGSEFCKLALTETKGFARWLTRELEERLPGFQDQIKLHITGCPNSCGQHWIADIGIEGKKTKVDGKMVDAYYFCVGGSVGHTASIARPVGYRCAATQVPDAIERLLETFHLNRDASESLREFLARHGNEEIRTILAGEFVGAVARELPAANVPQGVEG